MWTSVSSHIISQPPQTEDKRCSFLNTKPQQFVCWS
jgi:hypothetical protein